MKIAIGCDPNAEDYKKQLINIITQLEYEFTDFGSTDVVYANVAFEVAKAVATKKYDRGILLCGTGIGVSISANKVKGAYAALANSTYAAVKAVTSNNANILCLGSLTTGIEIAKDIVKTYLTTTYEPGTPSEEKLKRYVEYDQLKK